jgi:hypothetical protein
MHKIELSDNEKDYIVDRIFENVSEYITIELFNFDRYRNEIKLLINKIIDDLNEDRKKNLPKC